MNNHFDQALAVKRNGGNLVIALSQALKERDDERAKVARLRNVAEMIVDSATIETPENVFNEAAAALKDTA